VNTLYALVGIIAVLRLGELAWSARNIRRLKARGAVEAGARHYPLFVALHGGWIFAMLLLINPATPANLWLLGLYGLLQLARLWIIASLGDRWTTRIIVLPGEPLVRRGPYRWATHPNYLVVIAEIAVAPLVFGAWELAVVFSGLNAALLSHRIRVENAALSRS
jgi:methyltransferase